MWARGDGPVFYSRYITSESPGSASNQLLVEKGFATHLDSTATEAEDN